MAKYLGKLQVSYEMISKLLMIDERLKFVDTYTDPNRQIAHFIFESDEPVRSTNGQTWLTGEGSEIVTFPIQMECYIEAMRQVVDQWDQKQKKEEKNEFRAELKKIVLEVLEDVKVRGQGR